MLATAPEVASAFARINVGSANIFLTLRKDRTMTSVEFQRSWAGRLNSIPDARVTFESQSQGGPGGTGRDITITLGGSDPAQLIATANRLVEEMKARVDLRDRTFIPKAFPALTRARNSVWPRTRTACSDTLPSRKASAIS